ncbi:hypothetical protein MFIFM68171_03523 [Madurella fahalii]|uniref:Uncharacterized protein n=1 Tax=Madurella fahalii TaxID=1157608 RepID=A0ABQ0G6D2_9PEZI
MYWNTTESTRLRRNTTKSTRLRHFPNFVQKTWSTKIPNFIRTLRGTKITDALRGQWNVNIILRKHEESQLIKAARKTEKDPMRREMKARVIATVLAGFEELLGGEAAAEGFYGAVMSELWNEERHIYWVKAAGQLAGGRTDQFLRTLLAVAIYMFQVASTFIQRVGGDPPTPPGRVMLKTILTAIWSSSPVLAGFAGAFPILLYALPIGFSCRHIWLLLILLLSLASLLFSLSLHALQWGPSHHRRWQAILTKDFFIGTGSLLVIILSAMGAFNSCFCWGRAWCVSEPVVPLVTTGFYKMQNETVFPRIVAPVLVFQLVFCGLVIVANWRGVYVMRWSEAPRRWVWEEEQRAVAEKEVRRREEAGRVGAEMGAVEEVEKAKGTPLVSAREVIVEEAVEEGSRVVLSDGASSLEEEFVDAPTHITDEDDNRATNETAELAQGNLESTNTGQQPKPAPEVAITARDTKQPNERSPDMDYDNFAAQKYDRRYFMILWKHLTETTLPQPDSTPPSTSQNALAPSHAEPDPSPDQQSDHPAPLPGSAEHRTMSDSHPPYNAKTS